MRPLLRLTWCSEVVNRRKKKDQRRNNEDQKEKQLSTKHCTENKISSNMNMVIIYETSTTSYFMSFKCSEHFTQHGTYHGWDYFPQLGLK
jgi:hypothetical protein